VQDRWGIAYFTYRISGDLSRSAQRDLGTGFERESGLGIFYNFTVTPWFRVSADLQPIDPFPKDMEDAELLRPRSPRWMQCSGTAAKSKLSRHLFTENLAKTGSRLILYTPDLTIPHPVVDLSYRNGIHPPELSTLIYHTPYFAPMSLQGDISITKESMSYKIISAI